MSKSNSSSLERLLAYAWYPALVGLAIAVFAAMHAARLPLAIALYAPVAMVGLAAVLLPAWFPERPDWRPSRADVQADATFLAIVQVLLPKALAALAVLALSSWAHAAGQSSSTFMLGMNCQPMMLAH